MDRSRICSVALSTGLLFTQFAYAADTTTHPQIWDWSGSYFGAHAAAIKGFFDVNTPLNRSIYGDQIQTPGFMIALQGGYHWQAYNPIIVYGVEATMGGIDAQGSNTCFAYDGRYVSSNCIVEPSFNATLALRAGVLAGDCGRTVFYIKAGLALLHNKYEISGNAPFDEDQPIDHITKSATQLGGILGGGMEFAMTPEWSIKLEYNLQELARTDIGVPASTITSKNYISFSNTPRYHADAKQAMNQLLLGVNYHPCPMSPNTHLMPSGQPLSNLQIHTGIRYYYSMGRFQKDLPSLTDNSSLNSRLVYDDLKTHSGELFSRADTCTNLFAKAIVGLGHITSGKMNDEDWGLVYDAPVPFPDEYVGYSNTLSHLNDDSILYANIDFGYDFFKGCDYKIGAFIGYSYIKEQYSAHDITVLSPSFIIDLVANEPVITETDEWKCLRLGFAVHADILSCWSLDLDCAYLPYARFAGIDNHWLRDITWHESSHGRGVEFEAIANYHLTPKVNIGAGVRYWSIWADDGTDRVFDFEIPRTDTYRFDRFGSFIQADYCF